jgi:hypothetical protein
MKGSFTMKYGYKEIRKIDPIAIRKLCIKKDWFSNGTNAEYDELLNYGYNDKLITSDELVEMATLIFEHSPEESLRDYTITSVMYELNAECCYSYFEEC